jgi:hypothetical protein
MVHKTTALERAFELARSGNFDSVTELKKRLKAEGYPEYEFEGRALSRQLSKLIHEARGLPVPKPGRHRSKQ